MVDDVHNYEYTFRHALKRLTSRRLTLSFLLMRSKALLFPNVEFCLFLGDIIRDPNNVGHMSVECDAKILDDKDFKTKLYNQIGFLKMFSRSLDDYLTHAYLIELQPSAIRYMKPGT